MELDLSPLAGWKYSSLEKRCAVDATLFGSAPGDLRSLSSPALIPSFRGCCWSPLTKCFLVCDPVLCCVRVYRALTVVNTDGIQQDPLHCDQQLQFTVNADMEKIGDKGTGSGKFLLPVAVDVNSRGEIAVADAKLSRVQVFMGNGTLQYYFGRPGGSRGEFRSISDLKFTVLGHLAIVDTDNHRVQIMTQTGGIVMIIGRQGWRVGEFSSPCAVDIARNGDLFVCDQGNKRVQRLSAKGKVVAVWGSSRRRRKRVEPSSTTSSSLPLGLNVALPLMSDKMDEFGFSTASQLQSVFDSPTDIAISLTGEIVVCDSGPTKNQILFFSDTGACRHVLKCPASSSSPSWQPIAINYCGSFFVTISRSPLEQLQMGTSQVDSRGDGGEINTSEPPTESSSSSNNDPPSSSVTPSSYKFMLASYPPIQRIAVGKFERWPVRCVVQTLRFLTYSDAVQIRLVSRFFHATCRTLRNEWKLFPLTPGAGTVRKYNKVVSHATGLVRVIEAFDKWGLRVFKPSNRIRRHVMDFDAGFCHAISALYGVMFCFQHEEILRALFRHHANGVAGSVSRSSSGAQERKEIDQAAFVEIVTLIEEVRAGFLQWEQCAASQSQQPQQVQTKDKASAAQPPSPHVRSISDLPLVSKSQSPESLRLVESAQQHQMNKLLLKLRTL